MIKILIGGGGGYIGTLLSEQLYNLGYDVTVIDLFWFGNYLNPNIKIIKKDLLDLTIDDFKDFEQFIFLAGLSNDPMADYNPKLNYLSNGTVPSILAYNAKKAGIKRFIYASSCSIYGHTNNITIKEDGEKLTDFSYGISKYQGELGVGNLTDDNFSTICLRMGTVGGYSDRIRLDVVLNAMYKSGIYKNKIIVNNPDIWRPILDIRDACQAYINSVKCDYSVNGAFNICSENITIKDLGLRIKNKLDSVIGTNIELKILKIKDNRTYSVNIEKAINILNFKPKYTVEDTVVDLYNNFKPENIDDIKYINIELFKSIFRDNSRTYKNEDNYNIKEHCRVCNNKLIELLNLKNQPFANSFSKKQNNENYPLVLMLCSECFHTQLNAVVNPSLLFENYLYVSGTSYTLVNYFKWFAEDFIQKKYIKTGSVLEIACNDCSLLDIFKNNNWDTYGVDPARNIYNFTKDKDHRLLCDYWNYETSNKIKIYKQVFDIIVAQNVFAHLDDIYGFLKGCKNVMDDNTKLFIQTSQKNMFYNNEFDTIYHEHVSFFSIKSMKTVIEKNGLYLNNVFYPEIHGTSYLFEISKTKIIGNIDSELKNETNMNRYNMILYENYRNNCLNTKFVVNEKLQYYKNKNKKIIGFGAAAKATVFINFCNIEFDYIIDENPIKYDLFVPGTNIIIKPLDYFTKEKEDVVCITLAWNFSSEITKKIRKIRPNNNDEIIQFYPSFKKL